MAESPWAQFERLVREPDEFDPEVKGRPLHALTDDDVRFAAGKEVSEDNFNLWLAEARREVAAEALREAAEWLLATGYPTDWSTDAAVPDALWSAFIDVAHRDADGYMHGNMLTRDEVDDWLSMEAGRPAPEGGADRG